MIKKELVAVVATRGGSFSMLAAGARGGVFGALALGALAAATIAVPPASAQPDCTAAQLSSTLGPVAAATGDYLASHPDANQVVTAAGALPPQDAETSIRTYFLAHPLQWADLKAIARPLASLRQQCPVQGPPPDLAKLFDAMAT